MAERRRYLRLKDGVKVIYKKLGIEGEYELPSLNIGAGGLCLPLKEKISPGTLLELGLLLPEDKEPFFCLAKVIWQAEESNKGQDGQQYYETGVEFIRMDLAQRMRIIHYVYPHLRDKKI